MERKLLQWAKQKGIVGIQDSLLEHSSSPEGVPERHNFASTLASPAGHANYDQLRVQEEQIQLLENKVANQDYEIKVLTTELVITTLIILRLTQAGEQKFRPSAQEHRQRHSF